MLSQGIVLVVLVVLLPRGSCLAGLFKCKALLPEMGGGALVK